MGTGEIKDLQYWRTRGCDRKRAYAKRFQAEREQTRVWKVFRTKMEIYLCRHCRRWHLATMKDDDQGDLE
jgi:uncharacterized ParB-like nuclease family protein